MIEMMALALDLKKRSLEGRSFDFMDIGSRRLRMDELKFGSLVGTEDRCGTRKNKTKQTLCWEQVCLDCSSLTLNTAPRPVCPASDVIKPHTGLCTSLSFLGPVTVLFRGVGGVAQ